MTRLNRNLIVTAGLMGTLLMMSAAAFAVATTQRTATTDSRAYLHSYNLDSRGLALEGYCPVTYHTHHEARPGSAEFASTYHGVDYHFVSALAKRVFDQDPGKYLPAYGGWCAFGIAIENKFPIDPTNFKIVNGRLMVFLRNQDVDALALWEQNDEQTQITNANAFWKKVSQ